MKNVLYMAPMLGYTDCTFREVYFRHFSGIDRAIAPFIVVSENSRYRRKAVRGLFPAGHEAVYVEPQILSKDPKAFIALTAHLEDEGFTSVNINMACPAETVVNKGRGAGFLNHPDRVEEFFEAVIPRIGIPLSVKIRTGRWSHTEIKKLIPLFNRYPISEVIIHPRLAVDKYEGPVNLDVVKALCGELDKPIVYSGNISRSSWTFFRKELPEIDCWMIGRELLRDPFLSGDIKRFEEGQAPPPDEVGTFHPERIKKVKSYHNDLLGNLGGQIKREEALVGKMKSYWHYLKDYFPDTEEEFNIMRKILKLDEYTEWVDKLFT